MKTKDMKNFESLTINGGLESIEVLRIQKNVYKVIHFPSKHLEFYSDQALKELMERCWERGWEITIE